jgi:hypothetical protein
MLILIIYLIYYLINYFLWFDTYIVCVLIQVVLRKSGRRRIKQS